jgi:lipopolysaccharide/colanic/teichoic acid biosynthesis glycosyltransferase
VSTEIYLPSVPEPRLHPRTVTVNSNSSWSTPQKEIVYARLEENLDRHLSPWCVSIWKRVFDLTCVIPALILLSPVFALVALAIRITSSGPAIFCQKRAGQHRTLFTIYKFRTMVENSEALGPEHTAKDDPRITPVGRFLRRFKLDELPQLCNVLRGDMSLVGPRPKLPNHEHTTMSCRPGVTGAATLAFCNEQHILSQVPVEHLEMFYTDQVVPLKIHLDTDYMRKATLWTDVSVLFSTLLRCGCQLSHGDLLFSAFRPVESGISRSQIATELAGD